jgi:L-seryl-tRNA(Ser) seleniumtransferase
LVEIGGSFRLPDIIRRAGAKLVEVGTTNRTRISDYKEAISPDTRLILRCHPSNFRISGFTEEADIQELVSLGKEYGLPVMDDLGSGALLDLTQFGIAYEPTVQDSVKAGVDLISFSGDKLLGASQAGILLGRDDLVEQCRLNPLARALRVDKLNLAALEATLRIYRDADPITQIPVLIALSRSTSSIIAHARKLARDINKLGIDDLKASVVKTVSETGGGSLPEQSLESRAVALKSGGLSAEDLSKHFRRNEPPIFGRIVKDVFLLDMRTVSPKEISEILGCARSIMG